MMCDLSQYNGGMEAVGGMAVELLMLAEGVHILNQRWPRRVLRCRFCRAEKSWRRTSLKCCFCNWQLPL